MTSLPPTEPLLAEPDLSAHTGFILAEEAALKDHLTGITVPKLNTRDGSPTVERIPVKVWYRFPEGERQVQYPFITIDLINVEPAFDLFHSDHYQKLEGLYRPSISPTIPSPLFGNGTWAVLNYLPFRLFFQVSTFSRSNLHDRYLTSIFMTDILPVRPFFIRCGADDTWRRTENLQMVQSNTPETTESGTKRIFRKMWTISMQAEIPQTVFDSTSAAYKTLRTLIFGVDLERFESFYQTFLRNQPDPLGDFTQEEREQGGEYFHLTHEAPPPDPP